MPVSIKIINGIIDNTIPECAAANKLKELLMDSFPAKASGTIHIGYCLTLCGQEVRDIDIAIWGELHDCFLPNFYTNNPQYPKKGLDVKDFCVVLELKEAPVEKIMFSNTHFYVSYSNGIKDVTIQSEKQRYSMSNYLAQICKDANIFVANAIWFKEVSENDLSRFSNGNPVGALPRKFTFTSLVKTILNQGMSPRYNSVSRCYELSSNYDDGYLEYIKKKLFEERKITSEYTRQKLEAITQQNVDNYLSQIKFGDGKIVFKGKAGTGKTFILLQTALKLANAESNNRCLLLTYNNALVSDIRRLLHYLDVPDKIDSYTVQIQTLHSFFMQLMVTMDINHKSIIAGNRFNEREYEKRLEELRDYVKDLMDANDIKVLKEDNHIAIDWDYILIDEAQDWKDTEKWLLEKIYGENRLIIADGEQQFVRSGRHLNWGGSSQILSVGRRQKTIVNSFVNCLAEEMGVNWKQSGDKNLSGGQVIIKANYGSPFHKKLEQYCNQQRCDNYDMLFLVPPSMVEDGHFKNLDTWHKVGINVFDGTSMLREQYSIDANECRLFQYQSCRGLEGWVVVCLKFDKFIEHLRAHFPNNESDSLALESKEERIKKYIWMWTMMAFTRSIDTLVITLEDPQSDVGQLLKRVYEKNQDLVNWEVD